MKFQTSSYGFKRGNMRYRKEVWVSKFSIENFKVTFGILKTLEFSGLSQYFSREESMSKYHYEPNYYLIFLNVISIFNSLNNVRQ